jgi:hypothetical protein
LGYAETYNLSSEIIDRTIKLRRNYKIKLPDAIIAATALNNDFVLVTRNEQDFNNIKNTQIFNPFSDRMKVCSQTSRASPEEREDGIEF